MIAQVIGDGNCFYKALSLYLTDNEVNYKNKREIRYNAAIENNEFISLSYLKGINNDELAEHKVENYIHKIKDDVLYAGIIEISLAVIVFNYSIIVYSIEEEKKNTNKNIKNNIGKKKMLYSILKKLIKIT